MANIIYVGMDVHTTNYTLCCYSIEMNETFAQVEIDPDYKGILKYLNQVQSQRGGGCKFIYGYEAGGLGCLPSSAPPQNPLPLQLRSLAGRSMVGKVLRRSGLGLSQRKRQEATGRSTAGSGSRPSAPFPFCQ